MDKDNKKVQTIEEMDKTVSDVIDAELLDKSEENKKSEKVVGKKPATKKTPVKKPASQAKKKDATILDVKKDAVKDTPKEEIKDKSEEDVKDIKLDNDAITEQDIEAEKETSKVDTITDSQDDLNISVDKADKEIQGDITDIKNDELDIDIDNNQVNEQGDKADEQSDKKDEQGDKTDEQDGEISEFSTLDTEIKQDLDAQDAALEPVKEKKVRKPLSKKAKLAIIISTVSLLIIGAIIGIIVGYNLKYIYIKSAEDFNNLDDRGSMYVLRKDIVVDGDLDIIRPYPINLKGKTLTVNGTLSYNTTEEATINIGTVKKGNFIDEGAVNAENILINATKSNIALYAKTTISEQLSIDANKIGIYAQVSATDVVFNGKDIVLNAVINASSFTATATNYTQEKALNVDTTVTLSVANIIIKDSVGYADINIINATNTIIENGSFSNITLSGGSITVFEEVTIVTLDVANAASITISGSVDNLNGLNRAATEKINALIKSSAIIININNIDKVSYYEGASISNFYKVSEIINIRQLDAPADINISVINGEYFCSVTAVVNADKYKYFLNGTLLVETADLSINLSDTAFMTPGEHKIDVMAVSNLDNLLDSEYVSISFNMTLKLMTPVAIIRKQGSDVELVIDRVLYAENYKVLINNNEHIYPVENNNRQTIVITDLLTAGKDNTIEVIATHSEQAAFINSNATLLSYIYMVNLANPIIEIEKLYLPDMVKISWDAVENAKYYEVYINNNTTPITTTMSTSVIFNMADIENNDVIKVKCKGYTYYIASGFGQETYKKTTLAVPLPTILNSVISWDAIEGATYYEVILDDTVIATIYDTDTETYSYTIEAEYLVDDNAFVIKASNQSAHFISSVSGTIVYNIPPVPEV